MSDWYEIIEEPIREFVRLLRNNGYNTTCSCGHDGVVECDFIPDGAMMDLDNLLYNTGHRNYTLTWEIRRVEGCGYNRLYIQKKEVMCK